MLHCPSNVLPTTPLLDVRCFTTSPAHCPSTYLLFYPTASLIYNSLSFHPTTHYPTSCLSFQSSLSHCLTSAPLHCDFAAPSIKPYFHTGLLSPYLTFPLSHCPTPELLHYTTDSLSCCFTLTHCPLTHFIIHCLTVPLSHCLIIPLSQ